MCMCEKRIEREKREIRERYGEIRERYGEIREIWRERERESFSISITIIARGPMSAVTVPGRPLQAAD